MTYLTYPLYLLYLRYLRNLLYLLFLLYSTVLIVLKCTSCTFLRVGRLSMVVCVTGTERGRSRCFARRSRGGRGERAAACRSWCRTRGARTRRAKAKTSPWSRLFASCALPSSRSRCECAVHEYVGLRRRLRGAVRCGGSGSGSVSRVFLLLLLEFTFCYSLVLLLSYRSCCASLCALCHTVVGVALW